MPQTCYGKPPPPLIYDVRPILQAVSQQSDGLQLSETSVCNVIKFRKKIMKKCRSLHFCLLDRPLSNGHAIFDRKR